MNVRIKTFFEDFLRFLRFLFFFGFFENLGCFFFILKNISMVHKFYDSDLDLFWWDRNQNFLKLMFRYDRVNAARALLFKLLKEIASKVKNKYLRSKDSTLIPGLGSIFDIRISFSRTTILKHLKNSLYRLFYNPGF